ncbi:MAG: hypothetical protein Q4D38_09980 [Planctomycetia bacterium]|nr:hypothetical protein [Planctomycetia bacterium]
MPTPDTIKAAIGFLTIVDDSSHGLFGGYLILNPTGRPVEFHCTAPVKSNRAQEILYGSTLKPYLYGEQIARTLIERSKILPRVVCLDQPETLCVRSFLEIPVVLIQSTASTKDDAAPQKLGDEKNRIVWKEKQILTPARQHESDLDEVQKCLSELLIEFDFMEPFERIREAIAEAQKVAG